MLKCTVSHVMMLNAAVLALWRLNEMCCSASLLCGTACVYVVQYLCSAYIDFDHDTKTVFVLVFVSLWVLLKLPLYTQSGVLSIHSV